jgi:hypothetical protein
MSWVYCRGTATANNDAAKHDTMVSAKCSVGLLDPQPLLHHTASRNLHVKPKG